MLPVRCGSRRMLRRLIVRVSLDQTYPLCFCGLSLVDGLYKETFLRTFFILCASECGASLAQDLAWNKVRTIDRSHATSIRSRAAIDNAYPETVREQPFSSTMGRLESGLTWPDSIDLGSVIDILPCHIAHWKPCGRVYIIRITSWRGPGLARISYKKRLKESRERRGALLTSAGEPYDDKAGMPATSVTG